MSRPDIWGAHFGGAEVGGDVAEVVMEMVQHDVGEIPPPDEDPKIHGPEQPP